MFQNGAGNAEKALSLFVEASKVPNATDDELRAAIYNSACAYVKLKRWKEACSQIEQAINDYDVRLVVALRDPDLSALRDRREWVELLGRVSGGIGNEGYAKLRAEASSPFQFVRLFLFGGLSAGAALGGIVSTARLVAAFGGTYDLQESAQTFGINVACLAVLGFLFKRELVEGEECRPGGQGGGAGPAAGVRLEGQRARCAHLCIPGDVQAHHHSGKQGSGEKVDRQGGHVCPDVCHAGHRGHPGGPQRDGSRRENPATEGGRLVRRQGICLVDVIFVIFRFYFGIKAVRKVEAAAPRR